jgi:hypothetical protein
VGGCICSVVVFGELSRSLGWIELNGGRISANEGPAVEAAGPSRAVAPFETCEQRGRDLGCFRDLLERHMLPRTLAPQPFTKRASFVYQRRSDRSRPEEKCRTRLCKTDSRERTSKTPRDRVSLTWSAHCNARTSDSAAVTITTYTSLVIFDKSKSRERGGPA